VDALVVSVDYGDLLAVTLPYNQHHFDRVLVVTSPHDVETQRIAEGRCFVTNSFYANGAVFNKWLALEEGLDCMGRCGWICLLDADVLWPKDARLPELEIGKLYAPLRRMLMQPPIPFRVPPERTWKSFPVHRNVNEWAGYSQVFHSADPVLGSPPWHECDWKHAGGADSFFQAKWWPENKVRFSWDCLHIGEAGANWFGRATRTLHGEDPAGAVEKRAAVARLWAERRTKGFAGERIPPP
jgi:hypothetical protein